MSQQMTTPHGGEQSHVSNCDHGEIVLPHISGHFGCKAAARHGRHGTQTFRKGERFGNSAPVFTGFSRLAEPKDMPIAREIPSQSTCFSNHLLYVWTLDDQHEPRNSIANRRIRRESTVLSDFALQPFSHQAKG